MALPAALKSKSLLFSMLGIVILIIGVVAVIMLMPEPQDTRRQAAIEGGTARVKISPAEMDLEPGNKETATVSFSPEGADITGVTVQMQYQMDKDEISFTTDNIVISPAIESDFSCPIKRSSNNGNEVLIEVSCRTTGGTYTAASFVNLFTFDVTAKDEETISPISIAFDAQNTTVSVPPVGTGNSEDILAIPSGTLRVSVERGEELIKTTDLDYDVSCTSDQVTAEVVLEEGDSPKGDVTVEFSYNNVTKEDMTDSDGLASVSLPKAGEDIELRARPSSGYPSKTITVLLPSNCATGTTTATPAPTTTTNTGSGASTTNTTGAICNTSCEINRDCSTGYCMSGVCRDIRCPDDQTCQCASTDPTTTTGDTELPESGFDQTMLMMLAGLVFVMGGAGLLFTFAPIKNN